MRELTIVEANRPAQCCSPIGGAGMSAEDAGTTATLLKALADPSRIRIVNRLATTEGPVCVCDLTALLGLSQPTVSFHMKKLVSAGLLDREQRGVWAFYSLNRNAAARLGDVLQLEGGTVDERRG